MNSNFRLRQNCPRDHRECRSSHLRSSVLWGAVSPTTSKRSLFRDVEMTFCPDDALNGCYSVNHTYSMVESVSQQR
jgi:hypothetical protein